MDDTYQAHRRRRIDEAQTIFKASGAAGLSEYLKSFSYGDGDKFCCAELVSIHQIAERRRPEANGLWGMVGAFIDSWDMTVPPRQR